MTLEKRSKLSRRDALFLLATLIPSVCSVDQESTKNLSRLHFDSSIERAANRQQILVVENYARDTDTSDDQAWQRAVNALKAKGGRGTIRGTATTYKFDTHVIVNGLVSVTFQGQGMNKTTIRGTGTGKSPIAAFYVAAGSSGPDIERLVIEDIGLDGEMTSVHSGHARKRAFNKGHVHSLLQVSGNLVPTEPKSMAIHGVYVRRVKLVGTEGLAIHIRGVDTSVLESSELTRCLDPGWIHSRHVVVRNNVSRWSADNGLSISRGCHDFAAENNTIQGAFFCGIHAGGFAGEAGPSNGVIANNKITNSGICGISAALGPRNLNIRNNVVDGVHRGPPDSEWESDAKLYGAGILLSGMLVEGRHLNELKSVKVWSRNIRVYNNLVKNAKRWGILYHSVDGVTIARNTIINPGSPKLLDGRTIVGRKASYTFRNIGIGTFALSSALSRNVSIHSNTILDNRLKPLMTYGVYRGTGSVKMRGNKITGAHVQSI